MVTTGVEINLVVFFKGVDVVEHKEWFRCKDANADATFSANDVESGALIQIPVKPLFKTCTAEPVSQKAPNIQYKRDFSNDEIIFGEAETVEIPNTTCRCDRAKHFAPLQRSLTRLPRGGWYLDEIVSGASAMRHGDVDD